MENFNQSGILTILLPCILSECPYMFLTSLSDEKDGSSDKVTAQQSKAYLLGSIYKQLGILIQNFDFHA